MTEPEKLLDQLDQQLEETMQEAGFYELRRQYKKLKLKQEDYYKKKTSGVDELREVLYQLFEDGEVIGEAVKIRDGGVYKTNSPSTAKKNELKSAVVQDGRFSDNQVTKVQNLLDMRSRSLKKDINNRGRVLMDDDRVFDAVTLKIKGKSRYLKLRRLDGGKSHKMQPLEDVEQKHVEELQKFVVYGEEKTQLINDMIQRVDEAMEDMDEIIEEVRDLEV